MRVFMVEMWELLTTEQNKKVAVMEWINLYKF
jgi:hypothetical protein